MKNNRCESNDRKMQDHDNWKVRRWKMEDRKMEHKIWRKMEDRKMQDQLSFICTHYTHKTVRPTVKKLIKTLHTKNTLKARTV